MPPDPHAEESARAILRSLHERDGNGHDKGGGEDEDARAAWREAATKLRAASRGDDEDAFADALDEALEVHAARRRRG